MPQLLKDLQAQFAQQMHDYDTLAAKADLSEEDNARLDTMLGDAKATKSGIERARSQLELAEWGEQSAGALPLAGANQNAVKAGVGRIHVEGFSPAEDAEGLISEDTWQAISKPEYKAAFREYLRAGRSGMNGMKAASIKTLQEGADTSGGF